MGRPEKKGRRAATKYALHFDLSNEERVVDLADVAFSLDRRRCLVHRFARDEARELERYDYEKDQAAPAKSDRKENFYADAIIDKKARSSAFRQDETRRFGTRLRRISARRARRSVPSGSSGAPRRHRGHVRTPRRRRGRSPQTRRRERAAEKRNRPTTQAPAPTFTTKGREAFLKKKADARRATMAQEHKAAIGDALQGQSKEKELSAAEDAKFQDEVQAQIAAKQEKRRARTLLLRGGSTCAAAPGLAGKEQRDTQQLHDITHGYHKERDLGTYLEKEGA